MSIKNKFEFLKKNNPDKTIETEEVYFIDGIPTVTISYIQKVMGVSRPTIRWWEKKGLQEDDASTPHLKLFDIDYLKRWHKENMNQEMSNRGRGKNPNIDDAYDEDDEANLDIDEISEGEAKRRNEIAKLKLAEIKIKKENDVLIDAEDVDKSMAEQAVLYESTKKNNEKILPVLLENRSRDEIASLLYAHNMEDSKNKQRLVKKVFKSNETFYDIAQVVYTALKDGTEPDEIIERITGCQSSDLQDAD